VRSLCAAAAATLLLVACAAPSFVLRMPGVNFELAARIAVKYGNEATSGNLAWRHGISDDELLITSPLGQGVARIVRTGGEAVLTTSDGREQRAADAETLTEQALGFRLPLAGLADWVRGRPARDPEPEPTRERRDAAGRLAELEQSGWKIRYLEYADALPSRLTLTYPGLELRLAISDWK
jgi:outer membrane lipoprotein LolB